MVSVREIWRGALLRVLPATAGLVGALMLVPFLTHPTDFHLAGLAVLAVELLGIAAGYGGVLTLLHRRLADDAGVAGRRAVVVGLCAPLGLLAASMMVQGIGFGRIAGISLGVGAAITTVLFAPWLVRRQPLPGAQLPTAAPEQLTASTAFDAQSLQVRDRDRTT